MRPILFEIFGWEVPSWHFFFVLAAFSAFFVARHCAGIAARGEFAPASFFIEAFPGLFVICYLAGWFGARALSILIEQFEVQTFSDFASQLFQIGPMTFYGGALAAILCGSLYCKASKIPLRFALDCGMVGGVFALGVGRIGCHLNGDDFGIPVPNQADPAWWAVRFPGLEDGGVYRYPVQLEEALASFVIGCVGIWMFRRSYLSSTLEAGGALKPPPSLPGRIAAWMGLLSAAHRFVNEAFRGDPRGLFPGTQISTSSGIAVLIVIFCGVCLAFMRGRNPFQSRPEVRQ